jgi:hypothetical protein
MAKILLVWSRIFEIMSLHFDSYDLHKELVLELIETKNYE